jgi:hypothetical protein
VSKNERRKAKEEKEAKKEKKKIMAYRKNDRSLFLRHNPLYPLPR